MVDIASPQIDMKIKELQGAVDQYSQYDTQKKSVVSSFSFNINSMYTYVAIPVLLFIVLFVWKPGFVRIENQLEDGSVVVQTSPKKVLMWSLILGGGIVVGLYGANYKLRKK